VSSPARLAIRVDVDTHEGMRDGVPALLRLFSIAGVRASFYLTMGPDRSGRAIFNVLRPGFLAKMRRTSAASLYGWRTVLSGTLLPSRPVATAFPDVARSVRADGHETGVHAWDHRAWQDRLLRFSRERVAEHLDRGREAYESVFGEAPPTFAAPAWLTCDAALEHEETMSLRFGSDCRGREPFLPVVSGRTLATPQVPTTLPTLDEMLGFEFDAADAYFDAILADLDPAGWPVLAVHAEIEGGPYAQPFFRFLRESVERGCRFVTMGEMLAERLREGPLPRCALVHVPVPGRHGVVSMQAEAVA